MWLILIPVLLIFSYKDLRERALPLSWVVVCMVISGMIALHVQEGNLWERVIKMLFGMLPGIAMTLSGFLFSGKLGSGDGLVLILICNMVGWKNGVCILCIACILSLLYSIFLLLLWHKDRNYRFPFVPFYLLAGVIVWLVTTTY